MAFGIVNQKIDTITGRRILYQANGKDDDWDGFIQWLCERSLKQEWRCNPGIAWCFNDPVADVAIRMLWAECFVTIDGVDRSS